MKRGSIPPAGLLIRDAIPLLIPVEWKNLQRAEIEREAFWDNFSRFFDDDERFPELRDIRSVAYSVREELKRPTVARGKRAGQEPPAHRSRARSPQSLGPSRHLQKEHFPSEIREQWPLDVDLAIYGCTPRILFADACDVVNEASRRYRKALERTLFGGDYMVKARVGDIGAPLTLVDFDQWERLGEVNMVWSCATDRTPVSDGDNRVVFHSITVLPAIGSSARPPALTSPRGAPERYPWGEVVGSLFQRVTEGERPANQSRLRDMAQEELAKRGHEDVSSSSIDAQLSNRMGDYYRRLSAKPRRPKAT